MKTGLTVEKILKKTYSLTRFLSEKIFIYKFHQIHKNQAKDILKSIESVKGKTDPKFIRLSDEYAGDALGWRGYAPWLYVYSAVAEDFKEGWIPDNYYGRIVVPAMQGDYGRASHLKALTNSIFKKSVFPDIAYHINGLWFSHHKEVIHENELKDIIFKNSEVVVFKVDNAGQGKGVFLFKKASFDMLKMQALGNGVLQDYIDQHEFFEALMPTSVATLRITTVVDDGGDYAVRACYLRLGRTGDTNVKSISHIRIPIDLKSGELDAQGYLTNWQTIDEHPDTHIAFAKRKIPDFNKIVSTALALHKLIPHVRCIGWDMIIDKHNNVKVMEWNGTHNDIKFSEATQGPCFSDLKWERLWQ